MDNLDIVTPPVDTLFHVANHDESDVTVAVTLYNYGHVVTNALASVARQDTSRIDLVVADDCSTDDSRPVVLEWMAANAARFGRCTFVGHQHNQGLAATRNQGFALAQTPFVFVLDADNEIYPRCLDVCLRTANNADADAVYTLLEVFGDTHGVMGTDLWEPEALVHGNYVDAMALMRRSTWTRVGGYRHMPANGWEDYDFWMKVAEAGLTVVRVPEILCRYRKHGSSMLRTHPGGTIDRLCADMHLHHPSVLLR